MNIELYVRGHHLHGKMRHIDLAGNTVQSYVLTCVFDHAWDDYPVRIAIFTDINGSKERLLVNDMVEVPGEKLTYGGALDVTIKGIDADGTRTMATLPEDGLFYVVDTMAGEQEEFGTSLSDQVTALAQQAYARVQELDEKITGLLTPGPVAITCGAEMTCTENLYLYLGQEPGYEYGYIYAYQDGEWMRTYLYGKGESCVAANLDITIPSAGWESGAEEWGGLYVDIPQESAAEDMIPILNIRPVDIGVVQECGMSSAVRTLNGAVRLYTDKAPERDIQAALTLVEPNKASPTCLYTLPPATEDTLGGVMIGDGVQVTTDGVISVPGQRLTDYSATELEVEEMLIDVFSE